MTITKEYDTDYRLTRILAGSVADYRYTYDAAGNIISSTGFQVPSITTADAGKISLPHRQTKNQGIQY